MSIEKVAAESMADLCRKLDELEARLAAETKRADDLAQDAYVVKLLVIGGYVSQDKVDQARAALGIGPPAQYFIGGTEVSRTQALKRWHTSRTYLRANPKTRDEIWTLAERGRDDAGVAAHLREAGIEVRLPTTGGDPA